MKRLITLVIVVASATFVVAEVLPQQSNLPVAFGALCVMFIAALVGRSDGGCFSITDDADHMASAMDMAARLFFFVALFGFVLAAVFEAVFK